MRTYEQFMEISMRLVRVSWPVGPCRKVSVNLSNLKDEKGRLSESPHMTMMKHTGGSSRLGGSNKARSLADFTREQYAHHVTEKRLD